MPAFSFENGAEGFYSFYGAAYDNSKPTIALLPPNVGHVGILQPYLEKDIMAEYNVLGLEPSVSYGDTVSVVDERYDTFTAAAEVAFILDHLKLPAVHLVAPEAFSSHVAFSLLATFPERVATLSVLGCTPIIEENKRLYHEMIAAHVNPWEVETWEEVTNDTLMWIYGQDFEKRYPNVLDVLADDSARADIRRPEMVFLLWAALATRDWEARGVLPHVHCDVLLVQPKPQTPGESIAASYADMLPDGGAVVVELEDATQGLALSSPTDTKKALLSFLQRRPIKDLCPIVTDPEAALQRVSKLFPEVPMYGRKVSDPFSFSATTPALALLKSQGLSELKMAPRAYPDTPCPLRFGKGPPSWDNNAEGLSARFTERHAGEEAEATSRKSSVCDVIEVDVVSEKAALRSWDEDSQIQAFGTVVTDTMPHPYE